MKTRPARESASDDGVLLPGAVTDGDRRSFLKLVGFGVASAALAGCSRGPAKQVVTWLKAPEGILPGRAYQIATTCAGCPAGCGALGRCLDGRPVKLEGNPGHALSRGGLCAVGQAQVLSLYDSHRLDGPRKDGAAAIWQEADAEIMAALATAREKGGRVRLLSGTITSPSTRQAITRFLGRFRDARHVVYDPLSASAVLEAHAATHGRRCLPRYRFDRADVIAAFDADFLGTWISPVEFAAGYAARRDPGCQGGMSRHWHIESRMSVTGGCADRRLRVAPWETGALLAGLCDLLGAKAGRRHPASGAASTAPHAAALASLTDDLWAARGRSLVVCGVNDPSLQTLVNLANELLGNYGATLDLQRPSLQRQGGGSELAELAGELEAGTVDVLLVHGVNPAYDLPPGSVLGTLVARAGLLVSFASLLDETASLAGWICPEPHALESWNDGEPVAGLFTLTQPTVPALRSARTLRASLARWTEDDRADDELLRAHWREEVFTGLGGGKAGFEAFFHQALHDGFVDRGAPADAPPPPFRMPGVRLPEAGSAPAAGAFAAVLYAKVSMLDGSHAQNPWLQELPDPVSRIAWESYATLSDVAAGRLGVEEGDVVAITPGEGLPVLELPVHVQPGQHDRVVAVALGYGRLGTDRFADVGPDWWEGEHTVSKGGTIGVNASPLRLFAGGHLRLEGHAVEVKPTGASHELASVQGYQGLDVPAHLAPAGGGRRDVARSLTLHAFREDARKAVHGEHAHPEHELWPPDHASGGHHWGLAVDLNACTGCAACVVACQAENNVPVVGRDEVRRHREMSWIRIDRYHQGGGDDVEVFSQPMMCQHCDHAPCESVCPVLATVHGSEGLNQQVYNRCVGTRYCANTCPYKVRRFNWFDYPRVDRLQNHSLNPDVTVRSRGVMEKCTMCIQRIHEAKLEARRRGTPLADGEIQVACQQSCPTRAITFGDLADPQSALSRKVREGRAYRALAETNVEPSVSYLARVRNVGAREG